MSTSLTAVERGAVVTSICFTAEMTGVSVSDITLSHRGYQASIFIYEDAASTTYADLSAGYEMMRLLNVSEGDIHQQDRFPDKNTGYIGCSLIRAHCTLVGKKIEVLIYCALDPMAQETP